jgi:hypothetical protein
VVYTHEIICFLVFSWNTIFFCVFVRLSRNNFVTVTHEIHSWRWTLTKYQTLTKSIREGELLTKYRILTKSVREGELSRNTTKNRHENTDANLVAILFSWEWLSRTPVTKRMRGGELSRKCVFRVSITASVNAWRCTLTNYFRESKTIFRDYFSLSRNLEFLVVTCHMNLNYWLYRIKIKACVSRWHPKGRICSRY